MALEICSLLEWDTEFFAYRIARLNLSQLKPENIALIDIWCEDNQIECLYFLADSDDALTTRLANTVIKLSYQDEALAFVSCTLDQERATGAISLIGVAENMRGRGLGLAMVQIALNYFRQEGMQFAEVVTQGPNIAAQRLYQKCGFRTKQTSLWYHKWFN